MKKLILFCLVFIAIQASAQQTIFWSDNFDPPAGGATFNNDGVGWSGSTATPGGGQNTTILGISDDWTIGNTNTPTGICVGTGNKLYITAAGYTTANKYESDIYTDKYDATPNISTVGVTNITLVFSWRCNGVSGSDYGQVGLSNNGGTSWTWLSTQYQGESTCQMNDSIAIPNTYNGISNFQVAYRFISSATSCSACDPPFNIDNIQLIGTTTPAGPPVAKISASDTVTCQGTCITYTDSSTGSPTSRHWTFTGGTPDTSSAATVTVCYSGSGTFPVKLWVSNSSGPDSVTRNIAIVAKPNAGADQNACQYGTVTMAATGLGTWTMNPSNPTVVTIANASSPTTTVSGFSLAGTYTFSWTNNGCSDTMNITVAAKPNAGTDQTICQYESITLAASGNGLWSGAPSNISLVSFANTSSPTSGASGFNGAGIYQLLWTLGGCSDTMDVHVTAKPNAGSDQNICQFGTATMTATGAGTWTADGSNPAFSNIVSITSPTTEITGFTQPGAYTFYWSLNGCQDTVVITVTTGPAASIAQSGDSLVASPAGAAYQWIKNNALITGATAQVYVPTASGDYRVIVTESGCSDTSTVYKFVYSGINSLAEPNVTITPNPFNDHIDIGFGEASGASVTIYSILGSRMLSQTYHYREATIDLSDLAAGVYLIHIRTGAADITRKIVKQ